MLLSASVVNGCVSVLVVVDELRSAECKQASVVSDSRQAVSCRDLYRKSIHAQQQLLLSA
jgi:hypothetical protein